MKDSLKLAYGVVRTVSTKCSGHGLFRSTIQSFAWGNLGRSRNTTGYSISRMRLKMVRFRTRTELLFPVGYEDICEDGSRFSSFYSSLQTNIFNLVVGHDVLLDNSTLVKVKVKLSLCLN
jgi:hypothetical protein